MGIDAEKFVDVNPELLCSICQDVFDNPVETPCKHVFCSSCIYNWVNRSITRENNCPTCRAKVDHFHIHAALPIIGNLLAKQEMYCDNLAQGCTKVVAMEKMRSHLAVCSYSLVRCCHDGCEELALRKDLKKRELACVKRKIVCSSGRGRLVGVKQRNNHVRTFSRLKRHLHARGDTMENILPLKETRNSADEEMVLKERSRKEQADRKDLANNNLRKLRRGTKTKRESKRIQKRKRLIKL